MIECYTLQLFLDYQTLSHTENKQLSLTFSVTIFDKIAGNSILFNNTAQLKMHLKCQFHDV